MNKLIKLFLAANLFFAPSFIFAGSSELLKDFETQLNATKKPVKNKQSCQKLIEAVKNNDLQTVKNLVYAGADINCTDRAGHSPMFYVFEYRKQDNRQMASFLLEGAPSLNSEDGKISKADLSLKSNYSPNAGCYMLALMESGGLDLFKKLLDAGLSPNLTCGKEKMPLLSLAVYKNPTPSDTMNYHKEAVKILLDKNASLLFEDAYGNIPLHYAVYRNASSARIEGTSLQALLSKPFVEAKQIFAQNNDGFTPLMLSVTSNRFDTDYNVLKYLIGFINPCSGSDCKIDVQKTKNDGATLYMLAAKKGVYPFCIVQTALNPGANVLDKRGKRAIDYIDRRYYPNINELDCLRLFGNQKLISEERKAL